MLTSTTEGHPRAVTITKNAECIAIPSELYRDRLLFLPGERTNLVRSHNMRSIKVSAPAYNSGCALYHQFDTARFVPSCLCSKILEVFSNGVETASKESISFLFTILAALIPTESTTRTSLPSTATTLRPAPSAAGLRLKGSKEVRRAHRSTPRTIHPDNLQYYTYA